MPGQSDADQNGSMWDEHQFTVNQNGEHTLVGVPNFGFGPRYDGSQIRNYDGTWTTYSPRKNNMLDLYKLGFNTNTNVSFAVVMKKHHFIHLYLIKMPNQQQKTILLNVTPCC